MSSTVEQIKERLGITDVVSSYVKLEGAGRNLKARCPFHTEKTASFFVSPDRETYHCFGCGKGGDIFSFVEEIEGVDFSGALKVLAERAGVTIDRFEQKNQDTKRPLYEILEDATGFFEAQLRRHTEVGEYLKSRGLEGKTAKMWRIGYVPAEWRALYSFLKHNNYSDNDIIASGLAARSNGNTYDRFRGRVMFPIMDSSGRPIAFSGRIFGEEEHKGVVSAKYINSPETLLYDKSNTLYGFDKAKMEMRKRDACIVVEGQMDVIMSHQAGFLNTVAASGTAFTPGHLTRIGRLTKNIILAFDADEAGLRAAERGIHLALLSGFSVRVVHLSSGLDPADAVKADKNTWKEYVDGAKHVIEFYLDMLAESFSDTRTLRMKVEERVIPFVARLKSPIEQAHFVKSIIQRIHIEEEPVWRSIAERQKADRILENKDAQSAVKRFMRETQNPEHIRLSNIQKHIHSIFLWQKQDTEPMIDADDFQKKYEQITARRLEEEIRSIPDEEKARLIFEAEAAYQNSEHMQKVLEELFVNLHRQVLKIALMEATDAVRKAEESGNEPEAKKALAQCHALSQKINEISISPTV